ncbi:hypothetical protein WICPIJ_001387 [Wickerhamomyces pijperi]|uniref:phosphoinositide 5-phosphatase n=1 Tax=Wickerhamomyces pijperi TaxID=599730 RepID=A0A9P8TQU6_WICPI|nr:hypothetical protein WICPIJ_001387 [Wickerhamomyces pijperi]
MPNGSKRCVIEFLPTSQVNLRPFKPLSDRHIYGLLGLIEVENDYFICCITGTKQVASPMPSQTIYRIYGVDFFSINNEKWDFLEFDTSGLPILPDVETEEEERSNGNYVKHPCTDLRKLLSTGGFYYSSNFDLTNSLQSRGVNSHSLSVDQFNQEYMWNSFMLDEVIKFRNKLDPHTKEVLDDEGFLTTVIRGFAETFQTNMQSENTLVTIISRQSWKRAGTRYNSRGIDDDAYVSNFVETEYILYSNKMIYSYLQIRGSIPVFWEQDTSLINAKVSITRSEEATQPIFNRHFDRLIDTYGDVNVVNLLNKDKKDEHSLTVRYRYHLEKANNPNIFLTEFDFHRETSANGYSSANNIFRIIKENLFEFGFFSYDLQTNQAVTKQTGIFRTNCLDCLDRTNLVQQFISSFAVSCFLQQLGLRIPQESDFFITHNSLWADNGDQISQIYTGTNALKSSFSRNGGKMSFAMKLSDATKSVSRLYINNFQDKGKQFTIDMLLGRLNGQLPVLLYDPVTDYVNDRLTRLKHHYCYYDSANLFVGTFNVNAFSNFRNLDLSDWLYPIGNKFQPDIVVLGFQEVIELTAGSILNADYSKTKFWTDEVLNCLNQFDSKYVMLRAEQMSSLIILFFVKSENVNNVKAVEGALKKTGLGGMAGNKGAVAIRFNYGSSNFCFVNAHLAAGSNNVQERNNDFSSILNGIKFQRSGKIDDNDIVFWLGDLNYRLNLESTQVRQLVDQCSSSGNFEQLIQFDQLTREIQRGNSFANYQEASVNFKPTYKYDKGTDRYDSSEKQRTPSWTDRIIYKHNEDLKPWAYQSSDKVMISDHKPVYFVARCKVEFIDEEKKERVVDKLHEEYQIKFGDNEGKASLIEVTKPNAIESNFKPALPERSNTANSLSSSSRRSSPNPIPSETSTTATSAVSSAGGQYNSSSVPPPPPAPRGDSTANVSNVTSSISPPPVPQPRKLPPGFNSEMVLQPSRGNTPVTSKSNTPSNTEKPTPKNLTPAATGTSVKKSNGPVIPNKPESLRTTSPSTITISQSDSESINSVSLPPVPAPRKESSQAAVPELQSWQAMVPKKK